MDETQVAKWADLLTGYCLAVQPGEAVAIVSELEARPLVEACFRAVIDRGGHPLLRLSLPGLEEYRLLHASETQLSRYPMTLAYEAETVPCRIRIAAETDTRSMAQVDPRRQAIRDRALGNLRELSRRNRWVITQYPTAAYAAEANMTLEDYTNYVARSMFLDQPDPAEAWRDLGRRQAGLIKFMTGARTVRIEGDDTDLTFSVAGRTWINSDGRRNMPSGEIFTGPIEESIQGRLRSTFPVCRDGRRLEGIELEFRDGVVVHARAQAEEAYLLSMLDLDPGARRLGEFGIGLNSGIDRFTGSILYDEKIGGTVHLALGQSYPETGGVNESSLHWDLILDLRSKGRITVDDRVVMENGRWHVG